MFPPPEKQEKLLYNYAKLDYRAVTYITKGTAQDPIITKEKLQLRDPLLFLSLENYKLN